MRTSTTMFAAVAAAAVGAQAEWCAMPQIQHAVVIFGDGSDEAVYSTDSHTLGGEDTQGLAVRGSAVIGVDHATSIAGSSIVTGEVLKWEPNWEMPLTTEESAFNSLYSLDDWRQYAKDLADASVLGDNLGGRVVFYYPEGGKVVIRDDSENYVTADKQVIHVVIGEGTVVHNADENDKLDGAIIAPDATVEIDRKIHHIHGFVVARRLLEPFENLNSGLQLHGQIPTGIVCTQEQPTTPVTEKAFTGVPVTERPITPQPAVPGVPAEPATATPLAPEPTKPSCVGASENPEMWGANYGWGCCRDQEEGCPAGCGAGEGASCCAAKGKCTESELEAEQTKSAAKDARDAGLEKVSLKVPVAIGATEGEYLENPKKVIAAARREVLRSSPELRENPERITVRRVCVAGATRCAEVPSTWSSELAREEHGIKWFARGASVLGAQTTTVDLDIVGVNAADVQKASNQVQGSLPGTQVLSGPATPSSDSSAGMLPFIVAGIVGALCLGGLVAAVVVHQKKQQGVSFEGASEPSSPSSYASLPTPGHGQL